MGDGTKEKPYTRRDVLRRIKANGGTAEGLDLSGKVFEDGINLREFDLTGIILKDTTFWDITLEDPDIPEPVAGLEGAHLEGASLMSAHLERAHILGSHLEEADLFDAHLEGALLTEAHLEEANLTISHLEGAKMRGAYLEGVCLSGAKLSSDTMLDSVHWGNYILGEERKAEAEKEAEEKRVWCTIAIDTYRHLKLWHTNAGMYDVAGKFFYREMEARRKALSWQSKPFYKLWHSALRLLCGYGEQWWRVVGWAATVVVGLAVIYYLWGSFSSSSFWDTLYYSAASFTALGYGSWAPQPTGWAKGMGAAEAFIGVFSMALFLVTFTRKMTR
jgi:hypothetical protein